MLEPWLGKSNKKLGKGPAESIENGAALSQEIVNELFQAGKDWAVNLANEELVVLAECVPGGTTTALAVLLALGIPAQNLLSGSLPGANLNFSNQAKIKLTLDGIEAAAKRLNIAKKMSLFF